MPINLPLTVVTNSPEESIILGEKFAGLLEKGSIVALLGPIGAGKTCFAKGIAKGLGINEEVTSPTYTIVSEYTGFLAGKKINIYHIDAYRLTGNDDFSAMGGEEIVYGDGISLIEWSENIPGFISNKAFFVDIKIVQDNERIIRIYRAET